MKNPHRTHETRSLLNILLSHEGKCVLILRKESIQQDIRPITLEELKKEIKVSINAKKCQGFELIPGEVSCQIGSEYLQTDSTSKCRAAVAPYMSELVSVIQYHIF